MKKTLSLSDAHAVKPLNYFGLTAKGRVRLTTMIRPDIRDKVILVARSKGMSLADVIETVLCEYFEIDSDQNQMWLTVMEASEFFNVSTSTIRRSLQIINEKFPYAAKYVGNKGIAYLRSDVLSDVVNGEIKKPSDYQEYFNAEVSNPYQSPNDLIEHIKGFVYIVADGDLFKIGFSNNPKARLSQLKTGNAKCEMIYSFNGTYSDEQFLHKYFASKRGAGEWFKLTLEDIDNIKDFFYKKGPVYDAAKSQMTLF